MYYFLLIRDVIEVFFYACIMYTFCLWLKADKTKNLLPSFLLYCFVCLVAWFFELNSLSAFLFTYAPVTLIIFIIVHEKTLQRNLIALRAITPIKNTHHDWLDTLISNALALINTNTNITIVIEHTDSLEYFLTVPFVIDAPINKGILNVLLSSSSYNDTYMMWVTSSGIIRGINAQWIQEKNKIEPTTTINSFFDKKAALFYSLQSDAIIMHINHYTRTFTCITRGNEVHNISAHDIKSKIQKELSLPNNAHYKQDVNNENSAKKSLTQ